MFTKKISLFILIGLLYSTTLVAGRFYGGLGLRVIPGQPNTEVARTSFAMAYETLDIWRFSYTDTEFNNIEVPKILIKTTILGVERVWTSRVNNLLTVSGAFGVGYYSTDLDGDKSSGKGGSFGLLTTVSTRMHTNEASFLQASFQFRNAAIAIDKTTVDGGYRGIFVSYGLLF